MTLQELHQLASLGEGVNLEFKRRVPKPKRIAKEVIALANTHGGRILLGVMDDGTVVGVDDASEQEFLLHRAIRTYCAPPVEYTTERIVTATNRDVILVSVPESRDKPHHLVEDTGTVAGDGTAYVRIEEMSVEASPESVQMMRDQESDPGVMFEFGEKESLLMRYLSDYGRVTVQQFAKMANISTDEASARLVKMAKANVLQLHNDPRSEDYFTLAY